MITGFILVETKLIYNLRALKLLDGQLFFWYFTVLMISVKLTVQLIKT